MKTLNLIASAAAVLFTVASLSAVNYNVDAGTGHTQTRAVEVVDLAPVYVYATAEERRSAALMADFGTASFASTSGISLVDESSDDARFSLVGSQFAMPYYSFSNKFGRITKE